MYLIADFTPKNFGRTGSSEMLAMKFCHELREVILIMLPITQSIINMCGLIPMGIRKDLVFIFNG